MVNSEKLPSLLPLGLIFLCPSSCFDHVCLGGNSSIWAWGDSCSWGLQRCHLSAQVGHSPWGAASSQFRPSGPRLSGSFPNINSRVGGRGGHSASTPRCPSLPTPVAHSSGSQSATCLVSLLSTLQANLVRSWPFHASGKSVEHPPWDKLHPVADTALVKRFSALAGPFGALRELSFQASLKGSAMMLE